MPAVLRCGYLLIRFPLTVEVGPPPGDGDALLLEDGAGNYILLEDGSKILLE